MGFGGEVCLGWNESKTEYVGDLAKLEHGLVDERQGDGTHQEMDIGIEAVASLEEYVGTYLEMKKLKIKRVKSTNASVFCDGEDNKWTRMWHIYITTNSGKTLPSRITATLKKKVKTAPRQGFLKLL